MYDTIQRVVEFPKAWTSIDGDVRRSLVKRFPYGVLYSEEPNGILILAVMNLPSGAGLLEAPRVGLAIQKSRAAQMNRKRVVFQHVLVRNRRGRNAVHHI